MMKKLFLFAAFACVATASSAENAPAVVLSSTSAVSSPTVLSGDDQLLWLAAKQATETSEKLAPGEKFCWPNFLKAMGPGGTTLVSMSAAIGKDQVHGPRTTWLYQIQGGDTRRLFKLPFEAMSFTADLSPALQCDYWVYDCFLCDNPEAGFVYRLPVVAAPGPHSWKLTVDSNRGDVAHLKEETDRILKNALAKYGRKNPDANRLNQQTTLLFTSGLSVAPESDHPRRALGKKRRSRG